MAMDVCVSMYLFLESMLFLERMFSRVVPLSSCTFIAVAVVVYQIDILVEENGKNVKFQLRRLAPVLYIFPWRYWAQKATAAGASHTGGWCFAESSSTPVESPTS